MTAYFKLGTFDEKSWHGEEKFLLDHNNMWQAMEDCGMGEIRYLKTPSYIQFNGEYLPVAGKQQLVTVGADWCNGGALPFGRQVTSYEPLQHRYMADLLQPVIDLSKGQIALKGVGVVGASAETAFVQLDLGEFQVGGLEQETHQSYLLLADNKLKGATHFMGTNVRTVCDNTYSMAVADIPTIPHGANGKLFLNFHVAMLERALRLKQEQQISMERLFKTKTDSEAVIAGFEQVFPYPKPTPAMRKASGVKGAVKDQRIQKLIDRAEKDVRVVASLRALADRRRSEAMTAYDQFNDEHSYAGQTAYGFFQAATQTISHSDTFTGDGWKQTLAQLFTGGQKNNMTQIALAIAGEM